MYKNRHKTKMASAQKPPATKPAVTSPKEEKADIKHFGRLDRYMCDICGQEGLSDTDMKSHVLLEHVENQISCPFCDLEGTTLDEMTLHVNSQHLDILTPSDENVGNRGLLDGPSTQQNNSRDGGGMENSSYVKNGDDADRNRINTEQSNDAAHQLDNRKFLTQENTQNINENFNIKSDTNSTPKRARLYLEVPRVTVDKPSNRSPPSISKTDSILKQCCKENLSPNYSCPLCGWGSDFSEEVTQHVNAAHLDALTPTKVPTSLGDCENNNIASSPLECPLCGWTTGDGAALELHVHKTHREELGSPGLGSGGFLSPESPLLMCPMCGMEYSDTDSLLRHVDGHFSNQHTPGSEQETYDNLLAQELQQEQQEEAKKKEKHEFEQLQEQYGMNGNNNYKKQAERNMERAVCKGQLSITDYYVKRQQVVVADNTGVDDGHSCTKGIIESLHKFYKSAPYGVDKYWLCSTVEHYAASYGDKGWGCGYRNLQMLLSSLAKDERYHQTLFNGRPVIPSLPKIQRLIETAWQKGFDRAGCEQLGGKVVNTSKWIGATEIVATLSSLKVRCQLVDFHTPTGNGGTHPRLFEWVHAYFSSDEKFRPPLYLQHQGHSRTIIGLEQLKDGSYRLLLFDPSCRKPQMLLFLQDITSNLMRTLRRPTHTLKARQYQIVAARGTLSDKEYQESKMLKSEQVP